MLRFTVWYEGSEGYPGRRLCRAMFSTEREARAWINKRANGTTCYALYEGDTLIVESAFPVLMVA